MEISQENVVSHPTTLYNGSITISPTPTCKVIFGKYNAIGPKCTFVSTNHDIDYPGLQYTMYHKIFGDSHPGIKFQTKNYSKGNIEVGSGCWFGENVFVCPGVKIGNGAVLGAHSVITKNVEPYSIMGGSPAVQIGRKKRCAEEMIAFLESSDGCWYDWNEDKIKRNKQFFYTNLATTTVDDVQKIIVE